MSNLMDQMEVLAQGIATSARERQMAVGDGKAQTASMLQAFGLERAVMAKALKSGLVAVCERVGESSGDAWLKAVAGGIGAQISPSLTFNKPILEFPAIDPISKTSSPLFPIGGVGRVPLLASIDHVRYPERGIQRRSWR